MQLMVSTQRCVKLGKEKNLDIHVSFFNNFHLSAHSFALVVNFSNCKETSWTPCVIWTGARGVKRVLYQFPRVRVRWQTLAMLRNDRVARPPLTSLTIYIYPNLGARTRQLEKIRRASKERKRPRIPRIYDLSKEYVFIERTAV